MIIYPYISGFPKFQGMVSIFVLTHSLILSKFVSPSLRLPICKMDMLGLLDHSNFQVLSSSYTFGDSYLSSEIF